MRFPDARYLQRVEDAVQRLEKRSSAEVVVNIAARSGCYRDLDMAWGFVAAAIGLTWMLHSPVHVFHPDWVLPNVAACLAIGWVLSARIPALRGLLASRRRKRRQAEDEAVVLFHRQGLDATRAQTGVLIHVSLLEGAVEIVADHGVSSVVPRAVLDELRLRAREGDLVESLDWLADRLSEHLPAGEDDLDEIPARTRVEH